MHMFVGASPGLAVVSPSAALLVEKAGDVKVDALGSVAPDAGSPTPPLGHDVPVLSRK
jgi:hypothetical protein